MPELPQLVWSDALILQAVTCKHPDGAFSLREMIAGFEVLQRTSLNFSELDSGLFRLAEHGFVERGGPPVHATAKAREVRQRIEKHNPKFFETTGFMAREIGASGYSDAQRAPEWDAACSYGLNEEDYSRAIIEYTTESSAMLQRIEANRRERRRQAGLPETGNARHPKKKR